MCNNCNNNCNSCDCTCNQVDCACKVLISTDCSTLSEDLTCSNILKGQTLTEVIKQLDAYICERFTSVENFFQIINIGGGSEIYKGVSVLGKKELRTLVDSNLINLVQGTDTITISVDEAVLNTFIEANQKTYSAVNIGTGAQVFKDTTIIGDNTQFNLRKIKSSDNSVTITEGVDDINITGTVAPLQKINEGNGDGIIIRGRTAANYGNVGLNAVDLSYSDSPSSINGATSDYTFSVGLNNVSSNQGATTFGTSNIASGGAAIAGGNNCQATHNGTISLGNFSIASGGWSAAIGNSVKARSFGEMAVGAYNTDYTPLDVNGKNPADRAFVVGNGGASFFPSDAFIVFKNGLATLPSVTNALITAEPTGKAIVTKEYLSTFAPTVPDATSSVKGILKLTGDLGGTADSPTTPTAVHLTGNENWTGIKSSTNTGASLINGISLINNGTGISNSLSINNTSTGIGQTINNSGLGNGIYMTNSNAGMGLWLENSSSGRGLYSNNTLTGQGLWINNSNAGDGIYLNSSSTGRGLYMTIGNSSSGIVVNGEISSTGFIYTGRNNGADTFTVNKTGNITANSYIKQGGTSSQYLMADGSVSTGTSNLQKVITYPTDFTGTNYTLTNADNNFEIIIDNGGTAVSITVPSGLLSKIGVGFTQKGTGDVTYVASGTTINNPIGLKIKGQYYQTFLSQEATTNIYYLGGNTKV